MQTGWFSLKSSRNKYFVSYFAFYNDFLSMVRLLKAFTEASKRSKNVNFKPNFGLHVLVIYVNVVQIELI